jgi:hypothetical protein
MKNHHALIAMAALVPMRAALLAAPAAMSPATAIGERLEANERRTNRANQSSPGRVDPRNPRTRRTVAAP